METETPKVPCGECENCTQIEPIDPDNPDTHCLFCACFLCIPGAWKMESLDAEFSSSGRTPQPEKLSVSEEQKKVLAEGLRKMGVIIGADALEVLKFSDVISFHSALVNRLTHREGQQ